MEMNHDPTPPLHPNPPPAIRRVHDLGRAWDAGDAGAGVSEAGGAVSADQVAAGVGEVSGADVHCAGQAA